MKIGIDARLLSYRRGMGNYVFNLIAALGTLDTANQYVLYVGRLSDAKLALPANFRASVVSSPPYPLWEQVLLPWHAWKDRLDVLHCPANTGPLWLPKSIRLVLTVHDVMYLLPADVLPPSPSLYQRLGRRYRRLVVPAVARRAAAIVTDSHHSRQDIERYLGIPPEKSRVIRAAPNRACRLVTDMVVLGDVRRRYALDGPFILALAGTDPRKNVLRVIDAFAGLRGYDVYRLVLAGLSPRDGRKALARARERGVAERVVFTGFVPEEDLVALYNLAVVFLYPSLYEGFGLPVLEAMLCGTPVVASRAGSIPEVAGNAVLFVDPADTGMIIEALHAVLSDDALAGRLRDAGRVHATRFSWALAASEVRNVYEEVMSS